MRIKPDFCIKGDYCFRSMNACNAPAYFYQGRRVYRFDGRQMEHAGDLHGQAKPGYGTVSFHPTLPVAAFRDNEDVLTLGDFAGNLLWQGTGQCESSLISADGRWVWAVSRIDKRNLKVLLYRCQDGEVICTLDVSDSLYQSHVALSDIPHSNAVTMQLAAGQDGIEVHQLCYDSGTIRTKELFPKACYTMPVWKPDGTRFLTLENDGYTLAWYSYPQMDKLAEEAQPEFGTEEAWDNANGHYQVYLEDGRAIVQTTANRYFLYSPQYMERTGELTIAGYEPKPTSEVFPNLRDDASPYCEIECLERLGRYIIAHTWRRGEGATQDLLIFRESGLTGL